MAVPERRIPSRSCVACRTVRPKRDLVRVARRPDGTVVIDPSGKAAGRGAYLCGEETCLRRAFERGLLARALGVVIQPELRTALETSAPTHPTRAPQGGTRGQE